MKTITPKPIAKLRLNEENTRGWNRYIRRGEHRGPFSMESLPGAHTLPVDTRVPLYLFGARTPVATVLVEHFAIEYDSHRGTWETNIMFERPEALDGTAL